MLLRARKKLLVPDYLPGSHKGKWLRRKQIWTKVCKLLRSLCGRMGIKVHFHRRGQSNICNLRDHFNGKHTFQKQKIKANVCRLI